MTVENAGDRMKQLIEGALNRLAMGESITWDLALGVAQGPTGPFPVYTLLVGIPSALIGQRQVGIAQIPFDAELTEESAYESVRNMLNQMRDERSQELSASNGSGGLIK